MTAVDSGTQGPASRRRRVATRIATAAGTLVLAWGTVLTLALSGVVTGRAARMAAALPLGRNLGEAAPGVYRMGQPPVWQQAALWKIFHFRTVVNLAWTGSPRDRAEEDFYRSHGARYVGLPWSDRHLPASADLASTLALLDDAGRPVLVHCRAGRDRTGGLIGVWKRHHGAAPAEIEADWLWHGTPRAVWRDAALAPPIAPAPPLAGN